MKITYRIIFTIMAVLMCQSAYGKTTFSISNIKSLPKYEKYVFKATGTTLEATTVTMEYSKINEGTDSLSWLVKGKMPINGIDIEEEYVIRHRDLKILSSVRRQKFKRGTSKMVSTWNVDTKVNEEDIFLISTFQGIMYILRTFPFESNTKEIRVRMAQQTNDKIALKIKNKGLKSVITPKYGEVKAYDTQVSLSIPIVGGFLPNINYFFRNDKSHTLVAMKGAFGMAGKKMSVKLVDHIVEY